MKIVSIALSRKNCIMPREGIFGMVLKGGEIRYGTSIRMLPGSPMNPTGTALTRRTGLTGS